MDRESQLKLTRIIRTQRVAALGTLRDGAPLVSMILYVATQDFGYFIVHASRLAQHTQDFLEDERISLMISEADCDADDPQLLARVSIRGIIGEMSSTALDYEMVKALYLKKYPRAITMFQLGDFALYQIRPVKARFVAGFGKAFNLLPEDFTYAALTQFE